MPLWDHAHPGIFVDGKDQRFFAAACTDLNTIYALPIGKTLLDLISKRSQGIGTKAGNSVIILYTNDLGSVAQDSKKQGVEVRKDSPPGSVVRLPALGTGSIVRYGDDLAAVYAAAIGIPTPGYIALAHELIHALHVISGDVVKDYDWSTDGAIIEEARTVGIGPYANTRISENSIRKEHNLSLRTYYNSPGDADGLPKTS
jgi:hypothetical protein